MKKIAIIFSAICILCGSYSCSDMLENENSRQIFNPALDQKTDSLFYALGILQGMQQLADQYVFQGEMRGDLTKTTPFTDNNLRQLANFSASAANKYDSAYVFYRVINNCNYYIAHRDTTLRNGAELVTMHEYAAIKAMRAWAYMQLARIYGKVPFYTEPLMQISHIDNNQFPELDMQGIVARLAPDLEQYSGYTTPTYGGSNSAPNESKFDPTKVFIPVDIVLGDMYLETENYALAAKHYITYLTKVATEPHTAYVQPFSSRSLGTGSFYLNINELPGDWDIDANTQRYGANSWDNIFAPSITSSSVNISSDIISYIPMARSSQEGTVTEIPKAFGYDFYANVRGYVDSQIQPSDNYIQLSNSQDYYYYSTLSGANPVIGAGKIGDARYNGIIHNEEEIEGDSTRIWITKYNSAIVILYRNTTVMLHLAEAFNRLGMYDAAFAILKDGINEYLVKEENGATYISPNTRIALQTVYPILSKEHINKFTPETVTSSNVFTFGVHCHGAGFARDYYGTTYRPGMSPYQLDAIVGNKMAAIQSEYNITIGTTPQDSINAVEDLICDEYALEFAFEGSRFYDLCRLARHKNVSSPVAYGANFGGKWLAKKLAFKASGLEDESKWYLPFK